MRAHCIRGNSFQYDYYPERREHTHTERERERERERGMPWRQRDAQREDSQVRTEAETGVGSCKARNTKD